MLCPTFQCLAKSLKSQGHWLVLERYWPVPEPRKPFSVNEYQQVSLVLGSTLPRGGVSRVGEPTRPFAAAKQRERRHRTRKEMRYGGDEPREPVICKGTMNGMGEDKACADVRLSAIRPLYL